MKHVLAILAALALLGGCAQTEEQAADPTSAAPTSPKPSPSQPTTSAATVPPATLTNAEELVAGVRRTGAAGPSSREVLLLLGNRAMRTITGRQAVHPSSWVLCPRAGHYAAYACPFSVLDTIHDWKDGIRVSGDAPGGPCLATYRPHAPVPAAWGDPALVEPTGPNVSCAQGWLVQLWYVDGALVAANLLLREP